MKEEVEKELLIKEYEKLENLQITEWAKIERKKEKIQKRIDELSAN